MEGISKVAAQKLLKEGAKRNQKDPYWVMLPDKKGKLKRTKKPIPPYLSEHDAQILKKARKRAYKYECSLIDKGGVRIGMSTIVGLVPEIGDVFDLMYARGVYKICTKVDGGLTPAAKLIMQRNIAIDFSVRLVPFLGDIADSFFRCNSRNVMALEEFLAAKYGYDLAGQPLTPEKKAKEEKRWRLNRPVKTKTLSGPSKSVPAPEKHNAERVAPASVRAEEQNRKVKK